MVAVTASAPDRLHGLSAPGVALLKPALFNRLIVHLLNQRCVLFDDFFIESREDDDMGARLTGVFAEAFES